MSLALLFLLLPFTIYGGSVITVPPLSFPPISLPIPSGIPGNPPVSFPPFSIPISTPAPLPITTPSTTSPPTDNTKPPIFPPISLNPTMAPTSSPTNPPAPPTLILHCYEAETTLAPGWRAYWGYDAPERATFPIGDESNSFTPTPQDRGQPIRFSPGLHEFQFQVGFSETTLTWQVGTSILTLDTEKDVAFLCTQEVEFQVIVSGTTQPTNKSLMLIERDWASALDIPMERVEVSVKEGEKRGTNYLISISMKAPTNTSGASTTQVVQSLNDILDEEPGFINSTVLGNLDNSGSNFTLVDASLQLPPPKVKMR